MDELKDVFTMQELEVLKEIIDVSAKRGTWAGAELKNVGIMYENILTVMENLKNRQEREVADLQNDDDNAVTALQEETFGV